MPESAQTSTKESDRMDLAGEALKMAGALTAVVALLLGGSMVLRRTMADMPGMGATRVRILGTLRIGPGKGLVLVELAGEILVLGSTHRELTLLARVTDEAKVEQLRTLGIPRARPWPWWKPEHTHPGRSVSRESEVRTHSQSVGKE